MTEAEKLARAVCPDAFPDDETLRMAAHEGPAGSVCRFCGTVPYATEADRDAARAKLRAMAEAEGKTAQNRHRAERKRHADKHGNQHEFMPPVFRGGMSIWMPDNMHEADLNAGKQIFFKSTLRHLGAEDREWATGFFKGMGAPIDLSKKEDGRNKQQKWWKASVFVELTFGSRRFPGGVAAWLPSLLWHLGERVLRRRAEIAAEVAATKARARPAQPASASCSAPSASASQRSNPQPSGAQQPTSCSRAAHPRAHATTCVSS